MCSSVQHICKLYAEAPSAKDTEFWMTLKIRICPCTVQFPLFDEICLHHEQLNKLRLQVLIPKEPHSVQLLVRDLYIVPKLEQRQ